MLGEYSILQGSILPDVPPPVGRWRTSTSSRISGAIYQQSAGAFMHFVMPV